MNAFFCLNLLSDYIDGLLPRERRNEVDKFLKSDTFCRDAHHDLVETQKLAQSVPPPELPVRLTVQIFDAAQGQAARSAKLSLLKKGAAAIALPVLIFSVLALVAPDTLQTAKNWAQGNNDTRFTRYYPLFHGADAIIVAQAKLIETRDSFRASLWEEGGIPADQFERAFSSLAPPIENPLLDLPVSP